MAGPAIVGDEKRCPVEEQHEISHRFGVAGQIDAVGAAAMRKDGLRHLPIPMEADDGDDESPPGELLCESAKVR